MKRWSPNLGFLLILLLVAVLVQGAVPQPPSAGSSDRASAPGVSYYPMASADSTIHPDGNGTNRGDPNDFDKKLILFILSILGPGRPPGL